ncbi:hypothetical protein [Azospirillum agricola]|uniref:hypothetical protein n=1 Tax=Azospirillum agricola TaxID=1720247 RepID=UPI000A0F25C0|nr:hypothetical protein [Azospirillum agricola]SMH62872.1 hypothetical protein SAMN02982994_6695 [Azospirillum lipoferum]
MTAAEIETAMALLRARVEATSIAATAREIEYSRPAVSMALAGSYVGGLDRMARRVIERFGAVACPYLGEAIAIDVCSKHRARPMPTGSARSFRHWQACRQCSSNPDRARGSDAER